MVSSAEFTAIRAASCMRTEAHNQKPAPRLNAKTLYGSSPPRLVSRAPSMVKLVPSHFSKFKFIIVLLYDLLAVVSTNLKQISDEERKGCHRGDQGGDDHDYEVYAHSVHAHGVAAHQLDYEVSHAYEGHDQDQPKGLPGPVQGVQHHCSHRSLLLFTVHTVYCQNSLLSTKHPLSRQSFFACQLVFQFKVRERHGLEIFR